MASDILQRFLDQQLLNLGEESDKFEFLTNASVELCEKLRGDQTALVSATSVLLGGEMPQTDSTYILCDAALKKAWPTYRGRFVNDVDMLFRAALLQAISALMQDENNVYSAIVYYTATGILPHLPTRAEAGIFGELYNDCAKRVERDANLLWSPESSSQDLDNILTSMPVVDVEGLAKQLMKAGNPATHGGDNPHSVAAAPVEWTNHFAKGAAEGIRAVLQAGYKDLVSKVFRKFDETLARSAEAARLRSNVLYWKTALYHSETRQSFRDMKPDHAINHMAHDLYLQVPRLHPKSVEYFLREAIRDAIGTTQGEKKISLQAYCKSLAEEGFDVANRDNFNRGSRITPGRAIWLAATKAVQPAEAVALTGLPPSTTMSRADLAVEMFRDYQVARLAKE
jgi:hypothetical protein